MKLFKSNNCTLARSAATKHRCAHPNNPRGGGHCALNGVLRGHFPGNQDGAVNLKSELIFYQILVVFEHPCRLQANVFHTDNSINV